MSVKHMDYWNHVLWSDEMKINLFGSDGFKHVWRRPGEEYKDKSVMPTVKHGGGNVMVWGCMSAACVGELYFIEWNMNSNMYCEILQQSMIPSLLKLVRRAVFQQTYLQDDHCFTEEAVGKGDGLAKHVSRLEPYRISLGDLQAEGGGAQVSNIHQLPDVVMEEWKSIPVATCEALVNSMPRRVKAVLDNDGGQTKYWQLI